MPTHFTDINFEEEVMKSKIPVLVDFFAEWCGPCKILAPIIEKLAQEFEGKVKIGKLDTDESPETSFKYEIQSIPTLIFFKNGQMVDRVSGFKSEEDLRKKLQALLN